MSEDDEPKLPSPYDADPADIEPVSGKTKEQFTSIIESKTEGRPFMEFTLSTFRGIDLHSPTDPAKRYGITFAQEGHREEMNGATEIGRIARYIRRNGLEQAEFYRAYQTPDQTIEIAKDRTMFDLKADRDHLDAVAAADKRGDGITALALSEELSDQIRSTIEAKKQADELGLGFVSEKEVQDLLKEVGEAQPYADR